MQLSGASRQSRSPPYWPAPRDLWVWFLRPRSVSRQPEPGWGSYFETSAPLIEIPSCRDRSGAIAGAIASAVSHRVLRQALQVL